MTTSSWDRSWRIAAAVSVLTVIAVVVAVVLALGAGVGVGVGVPQGWWPHTGKAFAADGAHRDPCALIVGPAKVYCARGAAAEASAGWPDVVGWVWRLVPAAAGVGALLVWRLRSAAGQRRR